MYFWLGGGGGGEGSVPCCAFHIISLPCIIEIFFLVTLGYDWISLPAGSLVIASEASCKRTCVALA